MDHINPHEHMRAGYFGHRKMLPRACIADGKKHLRIFLAEVLEDLGFITCDCAHAGDLAGVLDAQQPDLLVLGVSVNGIEVGAILETLVRKRYTGKVLVIDAVNGHAEDERSEEHTSELQSRPHLVCRLLLEKKNTKQ